MLPMPDVRPVPGKPKLFELIRDYTLDHRGKRYAVRAGFKTDGQSIPRAFWILTGHPMEGDGLPAAIIHDVLYGSELVERAEADLIFKQLLERNGVNWFRAMMRYRFLRMFGGLTYSTHTDSTRARARSFITITKL